MRRRFSSADIPGQQIAECAPAISDHSELEFTIPWPGAGEFHEDVEVHRRADRLYAQAG